MKLVEKLEARYERRRESSRIISDAAWSRSRIEEKLTEIATDWHIVIHSPSLEPMANDETRTILTVWIDEAPIHLTWDKSKYTDFVFPSWQGDFDGKLRKLELDDLDDYLDDYGVNVLLCALEAEVFRDAGRTLMFTNPLWELRSMTERDENGEPGADLAKAPEKLRLLQAIGDDSSEVQNLSRLRQHFRKWHRRAHEYCYEPWVFYFIGVAAFFAVVTLVSSLIAGAQMLGMLGVVIGPSILATLEIRDARKEHGSWRRKVKSRVTFSVHDSTTGDSPEDLPW